MPSPEDVVRAVRRDAIKGLLIASPANPTGTMISAARMDELVAVCREHGVRLISDEIYHGLTYERAAETALAHSDDAVVINSFSKYFSMTGWRVGWMVVPEALVRGIERLAQNLYISPPAIAQAAALGAFDAREELKPTAASTRRTVRCCSRSCPRRGLQSSPLPTALFIFTATLAR